MNLLCTSCHQPTIAKKWLIRSTLFPILFIFFQIKCGRCKKEQSYDLNIPFLLEILLSFILPIIVTVAAIYIAITVQGNLWLMAVVWFVVIMLLRAIKLMRLLRKFQ